MIRFDVYGTLIGIRREHDRWIAYYLRGPVKRLKAADLAIPPELMEADLGDHLAHFCSPWASPRHPRVRRLAAEPEQNVAVMAKHRAVRAAYDRLAADYERRWDFYVSATNRHTLRFLSLPPGARVLDVGCGTGPLLAALGVAFPDAETTGLDLSTPMLRTAQTRMGTHRALVQGDVTDLPFATARFDCVVSASSFHFWRSPASALREIGRVLKPAGQLVITDWCDDYLACKICDRVLRIVSRAHHRIYGSGEFAELLDATGFRVAALEHYKINWLWGLMTASATTP